jgi:hypothetical protein
MVKTVKSFRKDSQDAIIITFNRDTIKWEKGSLIFHDFPLWARINEVVFDAKCEELKSFLK